MTWRKFMLLVRLNVTQKCKKESFLQDRENKLFAAKIYDPAYFEVLMFSAADKSRIELGPEPGKSFS